MPILRPILLILTSLSIIWDFGVFTQPYLLIGQSKITSGNYLMSIYLFEEGYFKSDFGRGAAISILMLLIVAVLSVFYVRKMVRIGDGAVSARRRKGRRARQTGWNIVGLAVFVVMVFPVFWMISTAFKSDDQIVSLTPTWFPLHPTLQHFRDAINKPFFWEDVKNSLIVVSVTVAISIVLAFLAAIALARYGFGGREALRRPRDRHPDAAAGGTDHPALRRARALPPGERADGSRRHLHDVRAAVLRSGRCAAS